jgi:uncharacterized membrane protein YeaQ/YmgE (transglycosylase-associated protein family)
MLAAIILIMLFGFITGGMARLAVPGPDPMPVWLTVAIGLAGSAGGGALAIAIWGRQTQAVGLFSFIGAILLVVAYRRFVQKRPITGPEAREFPTRGFGIDRFRQRHQQLEDLTRRHKQQQQQARADVDTVPDQLRKLGDLRDAGILTDEEFETKKAQLLARM